VICRFVDLLSRVAPSSSQTGNNPNADDLFFDPVASKQNGISGNRSRQRIEIAANRTSKEVRSQHFEKPVISRGVLFYSSTLPDYSLNRVREPLGVTLQ
jgi:hypothetical protein